MNFYLFMTLLSLGLYFGAPAEYNVSFCIFCTCLFVVSSLVFLRKTFINKEYVTFHSIFLIGNFFVDFVYPTFIYPIDPYFFSVFSAYPVMERYICKGTALCLVAMSSYMFGSYVYFIKNKKLTLSQMGGGNLILR